MNAVLYFLFGFFTLLWGWYVGYDSGWGDGWLDKSNGYTNPSRHWWGGKTQEKPRPPVKKNKPHTIDEDQLRYLIQCLYTWQNTVYKESGERPDLNNTANITKSCLLYRLCVDGKDPLPFPPPRSFSAPWYSLIEESYGQPYEVYFRPDNTPVVGGDVIIDQCVWKVSEIRTDDMFLDLVYIVEYPNWGKWELFRPHDEWHLQHIED